MDVRERWKAFIGAISAIGGIGYLMFSILESRVMSEAQRYFALTLVLLILLLLYIEFVVKKEPGQV